MIKYTSPPQKYKPPRILIWKIHKQRRANRRLFNSRMLPRRLFKFMQLFTECLSEHPGENGGQGLGRELA